MDTLPIDQHISHKFNDDLEQLRTDLLELGGLVEEQIADAIKAIETADGALADQVIKVEDDVDHREIEIDRHCTEVLAKRQPAASDLRVVLATIKINRDLERMGDEATKIARMAQALNDEGRLSAGYVELRHLSKNVCDMVRNVLDAFARFDVSAALKVMRSDREIDVEYRTAMREMITLMMEDPRSITRVMNMLWALRALERIGDHSRNIAEHVIYMVRGKDVRHAKLSDVEEELSTGR